MSVKYISIPGRKIELTLPLAPASPPCVPEPGGLAWFSDATGDFTEIAEAAYLSATAEAASPVLAVAKVLGETCGSVDWTTNWTPANGSGGDPAIKTDDAMLYVYQAVGSASGELRVSAQCAGQTLGSIALTLLPAATAGGGDEGFAKKLDNTFWEIGTKDVPFAAGWDGEKWDFTITTQSYVELRAIGGWAANYRPTHCRILSNYIKSGQRYPNDLETTLYNENYQHIAKTSNFRDYFLPSAFDLPTDLLLQFGHGQDIYVLYLWIGDPNWMTPGDHIYITDILFR